MLCFSKLVKGISLSLDAQKMLSELDEESKDDNSHMSSTSVIPKINLMKVTCIEKRRVPLQRFGSNLAPKHLTLPQEFSNDTLSMQLQKADSVVSKREAVNKMRKNSSKSMTRKDMMNKDKSVYKQVMFSSGQNQDDRDGEYISLHKRTIKLDIKEHDFEYRIRPIVYCPICKKNKSITVLESSIPTDDEKKNHNEKIKKERDSLYVCED